MLTVYYLRGLPGSGKSTWAKEKLKELGPNFAKRASKDDLRAMLDDGQWSRGNEAFVVNAEQQIAEAALLAGKHVIIDNTGFAQVHINRYTELAKKHKAKFEMVDFTNVSVEDCIKRDLKRLNSVGEVVIRGMHQEYLASAKIAPARDFNLPSAVLCDLDGTLAILGTRNPYDASTCENDRLNHLVSAALRGVTSQYSASVIFVSGRSDRYRTETERWLYIYSWADSRLIMRKDGDCRRDSIVKREIYEEHIKGKYNVEAIFDDRPQVIRECWRELGFSDRIFDVGRGIEF